MACSQWTLSIMHLQQRLTDGAGLPPFAVQTRVKFWAWYRLKGAGVFSATTEMLFGGAVGDRRKLYESIFHINQIQYSCTDIIRLWGSVYSRYVPIFTPPQLIHHFVSEWCPTFCRLDKIWVTRVGKQNNRNEDRGQICPLPPTGENIPLLSIVVTLCDRVSLQLWFTEEKMLSGCCVAGCAETRSRIYNQAFFFIRFQTETLQQEKSGNMQ